MFITSWFKRQMSLEALASLLQWFGGNSLIQTYNLLSLSAALLWTPYYVNSSLFHAFRFRRLQARLIELQLAPNKTQWTPDSIPGPSCELHKLHKSQIAEYTVGRRPSVLLCGYIYLFVCPFLFCVYRYKLCGWWVHANMHICEPVWACGMLAPSTLQAKKKKTREAFSLLSYPS